MKKILFCLLAFYTPVSIVIAQNTTNSPTSMFGLGELSTGEGGQYAGLGGTGIALRGNNFLNNANPASLTELTEQRFQIDAGIMGAYQIYSQRGASKYRLPDYATLVWSNFHGSRQQCGICHHAG